MHQADPAAVRKLRTLKYVSRIHPWQVHTLLVLLDVAPVALAAI